VPELKVKVTLRQTVCKSWCRAPSRAHDQVFITVWELRSCILWVGLSDEMTSLSFVYAAGPCQCSLSLGRVPWCSRPYFTVSDLRLPFASPPTTRRVTVEVFHPTSTRVTAWTKSKSTSQHGPHRQHIFHCYAWTRFRRDVVTSSLRSNDRGADHRKRRSSIVACVCCGC
jgi:hypothetical protein